MRAEAALVSVLLPAFNARSTIGRAIDSVLAQNCAEFEVIVIDDASTDGTAEAVEAAYADEPRLRVLRAPRNGGPARARNLGLAEARGTWTALVDADDAWRPDRLERLLAVAADADAVFDNLCGFDMGRNVETGPVFPRLPAAFSVAELLAPKVGGSSLDHGYLKPVMRTAFLRTNAIRYDESLRAGEDLTLYLELLLCGAAVRTVDAPLYIYTTPMDEESRAFSAHSHTVPNDAAVLSAFQRLSARRGVGIHHPASAAISARMDHLRRVGPVASFYYARRKRDLPAMLRLAAAEPAVRGELARKIGTVVMRTVGR